MPVDALGRPMRSLRISVTDRCNLRCAYCMPEDEYAWLPRESLLTFEEIAMVAGVFAAHGVRKLRLTGGEPLLRRNLDVLVRMLRAIPGIGDLALTTNGVLLAPLAARLRDAGLDRVTVSLDTLRPERMQQFARSARHADVIAGIHAACDAGFSSVKINTVVVRGFNDDELVELVDFAGEAGAEIRFIEYMDVGGATRWNPAAVVSRDEILETLLPRFGPWTTPARAEKGSAPAERFVGVDGRAIGVIASTSAPFCGSCDRARLSADGMLFTCLYGRSGIPLRPLVREGSLADLGDAVERTWGARRDRGAVDRLHGATRQPLVSLSDLRSEPHREMHVRGG